MKFLSGVILTKSDDENVLVTVGEAARAFSGMIRLNETGYEIAEMIKAGKSEEEIRASLLEDYNIDENTAKEAVETVVSQLKGVGILV